MGPISAPAPAWQQPADRPARMHAVCILLHALFSACHVTSLWMYMLHDMQRNGDAGAQDPVSGPVRATCPRRVLTLSDATAAQFGAAL